MCVRVHQPGDERHPGRVEPLVAVGGRDLGAERGDRPVLGPQADRDSVERRIGHGQSHSSKRMRVFRRA